MSKVLKLFMLGSLFVVEIATAKPCENLPSYENFKQALIEARKEGNGGLNLDMWGTLLDRSGEVCAVAYTGSTVDAQWLGSRVISAQKANTANAFSLKGLALSTANLYSAVQPGGSLFGLQESNPVNTEVAYKGSFAKYGSKADPMVGQKIGGVNVFGGGLALYNNKGQIVGALGVSGDTSCADHNIAWRLRNKLNLDHVTAGVSADKNDQIIYDLAQGKSAGGFGHPTCGGKEHEIMKTLPKTASVAVEATAAPVKK
ncbi:MAG: GlcG/HbpS family heme-binding protein [Bdellovibrio sp.]